MIALGIALIVVFGYNHFNKAKIGYIKSGVIVNEYKGMKSANNQFSSELSIVKANIDTLKNRFLKLQELANTSEGKAKAEIAYRLGVAENEYRKYEEQASEQMNMRKQELTKKVLDQVNNYIQEYGKTNNYKLILGTTDDGSILYGNEADDLTTVILEKLNGSDEKK